MDDLAASNEGFTPVKLEPVIPTKKGGEKLWRTSFEGSELVLTKCERGDGDHNSARRHLKVYCIKGCSDILLVLWGKLGMKLPPEPTNYHTVLEHPEDGTPVEVHISGSKEQGYAVVLAGHSCCGVRVIPKATKDARAS